MSSYPLLHQLSAPENNEGRRRLEAVFRLMNRGEGESAEDVAHKAGWSRQWLYHLANKAIVALGPGRPGPEAGRVEANRVEAENAVLRERVNLLEVRVAALEARQQRCVEVTSRRVETVELACFAANVSLRGTQEIVTASFGESYCPSLSSLQTRMKEHGRTARVLLDEARRQVRGALSVLMADDTYYHRADVKVVADPDSMALLNLGRWEGSSGLDWAIWLEEFPNLNLVVSDLGKDLVGAIGQLGLPHAADLFHEMRWFDRKVLLPLSAAETDAHKEWLSALDRATRVDGPGRRLSPKKAEEKRYQAEKMEHEFFIAMTGVDGLREVYESINPRTGRLWTEGEAAVAIDQIIVQFASLAHPAGRRAVRHLRENKRRYFAHLVVFDAIDVPLRTDSPWHPRAVLNGLIRLWRLKRGLDEPQQWRGYADWLSRKRLAEDLERRLRRECPSLDEVASKLKAELRRPKRSSSGIESLNSRLRVLQMVHRNVSDDMLALYALSWNLKPRDPRDPRGKGSPYQALGITLGQAPGSHWYEVLLDFEEQRRLAA